MHRLFLLAALVGPLATLSADEVQLRDKSAVIGHILAEKPDQVFVDIGYTVIAVPRAQITNIVRSSEKSPSTKTGKKTTEPTAKSSAPAQPATATKNLFTVNLTPPPERTVRELMAQ
ncbi:MAG: hypothetical protein ACKODH_08230, partial [Limisphaerales bacterium]